ncbi:L-rhamnose operon regulatory protein [Escherichia coli]|uniref:L-rhamnose operon regulatory protein n=1 Tax=Escherichia coli TaxID=562 RepID=A0A484Y721_ECOLX|nr:L-rhamnose operon regulatory protein [Escherichia coli]VFS32240.1 L-rhamnose operon regulatory protein [Escherichia coli]
MTVLHSVDFFPSGNASVAIEPGSRRRIFLNIIMIFMKL